MTKKRWMGLLLVPVLCFSLSGCGESTEQTDAAMAQIEELDYGTALLTLEQAEEAGENLRLIERARGIAFMGQTNYADAAESFKKALSLSDGFLQPIDYDLNYYLAAAYTKLEEYAGAEQCYDAILDMKEQEDALFLRGMVRLRQDRYTQAREDFDRVIVLNPEGYDRIIEIYQALENGGYRQAGLDILEAALSAGENKMTSYERGRIYFYMGKYREAATELEDARAKNDSFSASLFLGRAYEAVGEYNYASNVYESYLAKDDTSAVVHNQLGMCRLKMKDYRGALESFQAGKAIGDSAVQQSLLFNEIVAYEYLENFVTAESLMQTYLKLYPDDADALREEIFLSTR